MQSLASFESEWFPTSDQLVQAGAIWPVMHTLQDPTDYDDDRGSMAFTLATILATCTNTLSHINKVLLIDGKDLAFQLDVQFSAWLAA